MKPNISATVGELYRNQNDLKESGFTLFYMAINIGSVLGFFICGFLGEQIGWHYGFGAAGIGMALGLIQFYFTRSRLKDAGLKIQNNISEGDKKNILYYLIIFSIILASFAIISLLVTSI